MNHSHSHPKRSERVAIFGGAFDPFHKGHSAAIAHVLEVEKMDRVIVVPSGNRPDKQGVSAAADRLAMAQLGVSESFAGDVRVEVSDLQVSEKVGYATIDLLRFFEGVSGTQVFFVVGQELLPDLPLWVNAQELKARATFLVLQRPGTSPVTSPAGWRCILSKPFHDGGVFASSTQLRLRLSRGERCEDILSEGVYQYCIQKKLYGASA
jgi:nicotinate-nucleotide adenylyltransferase